MQENQNTKTFQLKDTLQIDLKKLLGLKKLEILFHGHILLMISMVKKLLEINKDLGQKKSLKEKEINYMSN